MEDIMKLQSKVLLAMTASTLIAGAVNAATLDFRHEWKVEGDDQASRIKLSHGWKINDDWKTNVGMEMKFAAEDKEEFADDSFLTETELDLGLTYALNKQWQIKPGMPIAMTPTKVTIKPQLRVSHKSSFGLTSALRYRHEFANHVEGSGDTNKDTGIKQSETQKSKITYTGAYKIKPMPKLLVSWEANYIKSWDNVKLAANDTWEWDAGITFGYKMGNFRPYAEFWSIDGKQGSSHSNRQLRYRLGLKYNF